MIASRARALLVVALLPALAAACSRGGNDATTTVEFWAFGSEAEHVRPLLADFERRHPQIRVRLQQIPWSAAHEKLLTAWVGGALPDVFQAGSTWLAELHALGVLAPLDARIAATPGLDTDDFFAAAFGAGRFDATTVALPWYVETRVLFYRRDLLSAPGDEPIPRDWNQWRDRLGDLHRRGAAGHPLLLPVSEWETVVSLAWQHGSELLRDGGRYGDFRAAPFRAALDAWLSFFRSGLAVPPGSAGLDPWSDFAAGRFVCFHSGPWSVGILRDRLPPGSPVVWSTAPLPGRGGPGVSLSGGASLAVHAGSTRGDAAWTLVRHLVAAETMRRFHRAGGNLPARRSAWTETMRREAPTRAFWEQLGNARTPPPIAEWERIAQAIARHAEAAARGMVDADAAVTRLDAEVDAILAKRRWLLERGAAAVREL